MPDFQCIGCGKQFSLTQDTLDRFPGWIPRYCMSCKDKKGGQAGSARRKTAGRKRSGGGRQTSGGSSYEENLTMAEAMAKYTGGPEDGLFTDGACSPNPGPGGWGVVWVKGGEIVDKAHGHDPDTTNNRMELTAIIHALELVDEDADETLYSDSNLCVQTLEQWAKGWERNGWKRKAGPIKNLDLVQKAWALRQARPSVKLQHIRAHAGNRWNEVADSLATAWLRSTL